jgi:hypothetical protein
MKKSETTLKTTLKSIYMSETGACLAFESMIYKNLYLLMTMDYDTGEDPFDLFDTRDLDGNESEDPTDDCSSDYDAVNPKQD